MSRFTPHRPRSTARFAVAAASVGVAALSLGPLATIASAGTDGGAGTVLELNSGATASPGTDCPDDGLAYWHFVVTPNDGSLSIESVTLNLDGTSVMVDSSMIVDNGEQTDNVFVEVPDGYTLTSLVKTGTSATVSGEVEANSNFNLSHVCPGATEDTTVTTPTTTGGGGGTPPPGGDVEGETVTRGGSGPSVAVRGSTQVRPSSPAPAVRSGARYTG